MGIQTANVDRVLHCASILAVLQAQVCTSINCSDWTRHRSTPKGPENSRSRCRRGSRKGRGEALPNGSSRITALRLTMIIITFRCPCCVSHSCVAQKLELCPASLWICKEQAGIDSAIAWSKPKAAGTGLNNEGNTCFLNAALQCLAHTPALVQTLVKDGYVSRVLVCQARIVST